MPSKKKKASASSSGNEALDAATDSTNSGEIKNMEDDKEVPLNGGADHASNHKQEKRKKRKKGSDDGLAGDDNGSAEKKTLKVKIKLGDSETTTQAVDDDLEPEKKKKKTKSKKSEPPKDLVVLLDDVIEKLFKADKKQIFWYPVQDEVYLQTIKNPMDLSTLKSKLLQGKYDTVAHFKADLELIYQNAETFNGTGSPIHKQAEKLRAISSKELASFSEDEKIITPLTSDISSSEECMIQIIDILKFEDSYSIFHEPVPLTVPGYHELIKKPMDFSTLRKKVTEKHISISKFEKYLNRVFANAKKFNPVGTIYHGEAVRIGDFAKELIEQLKTKFSKGGLKTTPKITIKISDEEPKEKKSKKKKQEDEKAEKSAEQKEDKKSKKKKKEKKIESKQENEQKNEVEQVEEASINVESKETNEITTPKKSSDKKKTPKSKSSTKWRDRVRITDLDFPELEKDSLYTLIDLIWKKLNEIDEYSIFKNPVAKDVPGYYDMIKEPMDLSTMKGKMDAKSYENWRDFEDDVDRIYDNCKLFNSQDSIFSKEANRQQRWFRKWKKDMVTHFGKLQKSDLTPAFVSNYFNEISVVKTGAPKYDLSALNDEEEEEEEITTLPKTSLCYHLLKIAEDLKTQDKNKYFWNNVDESVHPNYKEKVKHPMSLSTIIDNCKNMNYKTIDQFVNDLDLIHSNTVNYFTSSSKEAKEAKRLFNLSKDKVQPLRSKTFKDVPSTPVSQPKTNKRETRASSSADIDSFIEPEVPSKTSEKKKKPSSQASQPKSTKKKKTLPPTNPYSKDIDLGWVPMIQPCTYWQFPTYTPDPNPENRPKSIESNHDATQSFIDPSSLSSSYSRDDESVSSNDEEVGPTPRKDKKKEKPQAKPAVDAASTFKTPKTSKKDKSVTIPQTPMIITPPSSSFTPASLLSPSAVQPLSNKTAIPNIVIENRPLPKHSYLVKKFRQSINFRNPTYDWKTLQNMSLSDCLKIFSDEDRTLEEIVQCYKKQPDIIPTHNLSYGMKDFKDVNEEDDDLIQRLITIATKNSEKHQTHNLRDSDHSNSPKPGRRSSHHKVKDFIDEEEEEDDMDEDEEDEELSDMEELYDDEGKKEKHVDEMEDEEEDEEISENDVLEHILQDFETVTVPSTRRSNPEEMFKKVKQTLIDEGVNIFVEE
ncbi:hypothetical protein FDP41_004032 [Naegleria fowleri]|uniref:Bromo domain-containing protein n=1 Tax=Naegleria fowleri TaxID=5763 RepID=A0A6A5BID7_NAEFO|nr:uncharacterized protein FDP41_004032 [Naegleria fowleri]KAF0976737.1 hypothetical protein FDP41_004032 [Naegleria fowleri]